MAKLRHLTNTLNRLGNLTLAGIVSPARATPDRMSAEVAPRAIDDLHALFRLTAPPEAQMRAARLKDQGLIPDRPLSKNIAARSSPDGRYSTARMQRTKR
jgi:hypothetical protein